MCSLRRRSSQIPGASHNDPLKRKDLFDHLMIIPGTVKSVSEDTFKLGILGARKAKRICSLTPLAWEQLINYEDAYGTLPPLSHK